MKTVYIVDSIVREVVPFGLDQVPKLYNDAFAAQCIEAPDNVQPNWIYDPSTNTFSEPVPTPVDPDPSGAEIYSDIAKAIREGVDSI